MMKLNKKIMMFEDFAGTAMDASNNTSPASKTTSGSVAVDKTNVKSDDTVKKAEGEKVRADVIKDVDTILTNLIDTAFIYNNDLQMAFQRIEMAKANLQYFKGKLNPEINMSINGGVRRFGLYTMDGAGNSTTDILPNKRVPVNLPDIFTGFQANWEVDFRGKLNNQKKAAYAKLLSTDEGIKYIKKKIKIKNNITIEN